MISIHAPREGRDVLSSHIAATSFRISIHAPREGRDKTLSAVLPVIMISIHAPREGRDDIMVMTVIDDNDFNPRAPRGARQLTR